MIDALVKALNIEQLGFVKPKPEYVEVDSTNRRDMGGRPCSRLEDLLKLYLYGYYNRKRKFRNNIETITTFEIH